MQSIDHLIDAVALHTSERKASPGKNWFSQIDLKYTYIQVPLDESIANRFINGFYGLTDMPATFQKN